jgi:predicted DNA-binding protein (MmcQ/YjbR family)
VAERSGQKALARLRQRCLALPDSSEKASWGHPNFRTGRRAFAAFEWVKGRPSIAVRLDAPTVDLLLSQHENFFLTPYGRGLWISAWADRPIDWAFLDELIERAHRESLTKRRRAELDGDSGPTARTAPTKKRR